jgi:hypothetical protein
MNPPIQTMERAWDVWLELVQQEPEAWLLYPTSGSVMRWVTIEFFDRDGRNGPIEKGEGSWRISGTLIGAVEQAVDQYDRIVEWRHQSAER